MRDLNPRSPAYKTGALTNYANRTGFFSRKPFLITYNIFYYQELSLVPDMGVEPI